MTINAIIQQLANPNVSRRRKRAIELAEKGVALTSQCQLREWFFSRLMLARLLLGKKSATDSDIDRAIQLMKGVRDRLDPRNHPRMWADANALLGVGYERKQNGNKDANLRKAIEAHSAAAKVFSKDAYPELWASLMYALATDYSLLEGGDRLGSIREAARRYVDALQVFTPRKHPEKNRDIRTALQELAQEKTTLTKLNGTSHIG